MNSKQTLSWSVPFSIHRQNAVQEIRRAFPAASLVRIPMVFTVIFLSIRFVLLKWLPELSVDWAKIYFTSLFGGSLLIGYCCLAAFSPPRISVTAKGIMVQAAQHCVLHRFADIASIRVDETTRPFATLKICFIGQHKNEEYPIAPTTPIAILTSQISELHRNQ